MSEIREDLLSDLWLQPDGVDTRLIIGGISYRVGRMSCGDYFLEPTRGRRLWLKLADAEKRLYTVDCDA